MDKIKLIIFDLDGVLVEAKQIHYEALNEALGEKYAISWNESLYQGDNTKGWKAQKTDNSWHTWNAGTSAWDAD